jgi:hypothetical protein
MSEQKKTEKKQKKAKISQKTLKLVYPEYISSRGAGREAPNEQAKQVRVPGFSQRLLQRWLWRDC